MPNKPFVVQDSAAAILDYNARSYSHDFARQDIIRTFRPSELTECDRKIIYRTNGKKYKKDITQAEDLTKYYAKVKWLDILNRLNGIKVLDSWVVASDCNYNIVTTVDCVIEFTDLSFDGLQSVVTVVSLKSEDFDIVKEKGATRKDIVSMMTDMWLIELSHGMLVYENRDNLNFIVYSVVPEDAVINSIRAKAKKLYSNKMNGTVPERPYKDNTAKECKSCEFFSRCWG